MDASGSKYREANKFLQQYKVLDNNGKPVKEIFEIVRGLITELTKGEFVNIPFVGKTISFEQDNLNEIGNALNLIRGNKNPDPTYRQDAKAYMEELQSILEIPRGPGPPPPIATRVTSKTAVPEVNIEVPDTSDVRQLLEESQSVTVPMASQSVRSNVATAPAGPRENTPDFTIKLIKAELDKKGLSYSNSAKRDRLYQIYINSFQ